MAKIIQYQLFFPNPPEVVWEYITNAELLAQWMMPNDLRPVVGHEFQFRAKPMPDMDFDGVFYCKVLEVKPFETLSYSWDFGPGNGTLTTSVVIWELTQKDAGTELRLTHRGFEGVNFMAMFNSMNDGWLKLMERLHRTINPETDGTAKA